jgi:predicted  nucleic acid-binding Zn-ribbon protein
MESIRNENEQLKSELQRIRTEIERVQFAYDSSVNEVRALKVQIDERFLVAANTPPVVAVS